MDEGACAAHRVPSCISDVTKSSRSPRAAAHLAKASVRTLYVDRTQTGFWWHALCDELTKTLPDPRGDAEGPSCQRTWLGPLGPCVISGRAGVLKTR